MRCGVVARKLGMSRIFSDDGEHIPVTVLKIEDVEVLAIKSNDKDGYTWIEARGPDNPPRLRYYKIMMFATDRNDRGLVGGQTKAGDYLEGWNKWPNGWGWFHNQPSGSLHLYVLFLDKIGCPTWKKERLLRRAACHQGLAGTFGALQPFSHH